MPRIAATLTVFLAVCLPAFASSDDAWQEFAAEVREKCLAAAEPALEEPAIAIDPFGSERFGLAILSGKAKGADATVSYLCVMDKQTGATELGSELGSDLVGVTVP